MEKNKRRKNTVKKEVNLAKKLYRKNPTILSRGSLNLSNIREQVWLVTYKLGHCRLIAQKKYFYCTAIR